MAAPTLIFCYGGNRRLSDIAYESGYKLGAQLPGTVYHPIHFADQDWRNPNRERYMASLADLRPEMATVLDWEYEYQLDEVLSWAEEAAQYVQRVLIVPKVQGGVRKLPKTIGGKQVVLAYSVPTKFGGSELPLWDFLDWPVHLLGGSPHAQMKICAHLPGVISADGNMAGKMAHRCRFWRSKKGQHGHWVNMYEVGDIGWGNDANYEAFRRSCHNIIAAWEDFANINW